MTSPTPTPFHQFRLPSLPSMHASHAFDLLLCIPNEEHAYHLLHAIEQPNIYGIRNADGWPFGSDEQHNKYKFWSLDAQCDFCE
jgi:hypothetical protein